MNRAAAVALLLAAGIATTARAQGTADHGFRVFEATPGTFVVQRAREDGRSLEGFVVDARKLVDTLRTRVLVEQGLGDLARVTAGTNDAAESDWLDARATAPALPAAAYTFTHHLAAPFSAIEARLELAPLDDGAGGDFVYPLFAVLALCVVLGLYALYRMTAIQVRFAERRNNFVAAVSHELKTPLTAIRMYGEMLRDGMVDGELKRNEYYGRITAESERLSRLINNVLELSRLQRRERRVHVILGDAAAVVEEVVEAFRPHATSEGFTLEVDSAPGLPAALFDRDALTQVLFNLLDNALKYGRGAAQRTITVRCRSTSDRGVSICVADRGPGVDDAQLGAIFEPFYRAQSELTRTQKGTGIGLSLVRGLVEEMQGRVEGRNLQPGFEVRVTLASA